MQRFVVVVFLATLWQLSIATSPIAKVVSLLSNLEAQIVKEGEAAQKEFAAFTEWCEDRSRNLDFEIKTGNSETEELKASIAEELALSSALTSKVDELVSGIATDNADLTAATQIRSKEAADFAAEEKELVETVDIVTRAIRILERQMQGGASMLQFKNAQNLAQALSAMVQASILDTADATRLTAFVQDAQNARESDSDDETGAPAAAVYESHSSNIVDVLEDLLDKAQTQLDAFRKKEVAAKHNYDMLKQSLEDEIAVAEKDFRAAKKGIAASSEKKSTAEGNLKATSKELASDVDTKGSLHQTCMSRAEEFQATTKSRGEELKVLAEAKATIREATGSAALDQELNHEPSFLQVRRASISSGADLAKFEAVRLVRDLARKQHSPLLAQLAARMSSVMRAGGADPFSKVKGLISDMIAKLEKDREADATKKAYCDKELQETAAKKLDKSTEIELLGTRIDQMTAKSATLKEQVAFLQTALSQLASSQAEMDKLRQEEKDAFAANKDEQEKGLEGIKLALKILRDYYAKDASHDAAEGTASGIIGLLETIESDMTKTLASLMTEEDAAISEYETLSNRNEIDRVSKEQDVTYKGKESKQLDKTSAESNSDRSGVQAELDAILEYLSKIQEQCIAKPEAYAVRASRRQAEIAGLKEALQILESETALLQRLEKHQRLRGLSQ